MIQLAVASAFSDLPILEETDRLRSEIDKLRPLPPEVEQRILQKLRLEWNYHSNAIEGNTLSYGETVAFLMHGLTAKGKPLKDHLDIRGHNEAINFLLGMVKDNRPITEIDIRDLHEMVLVEPYKIKVKTPSGIITEKTIQLGKYKEDPNHVETATGEINYYASPEETSAKMGDLMAWYQQAQEEAKVHPLVIAGLFHHEFVAIHPFDDGNGRMARLLMNLILMQHESPPLVVKQNDRTNYYQVLSQADAGEYGPLITYFGELMRRSLTIYLKGARGESLVEAEDVDKEIALFKKGLEKSNSTKAVRSNEAIRDVILSSVNPLLELLSEKVRQFDDLFVKSSDNVRTKDFQGKINNVAVADWLKGETSGNIQYLNWVKGWSGYKHADQPFGVNAGFSVEFTLYHYKAKAVNNRLEKLYHEQLIPDEMNQIVKEIIGKVIAEIKQKAENQSE
jgi:Fic family protein